MPRAIPQLLPPTHVKKATLLPPRPNPATQPHEQAEDFRHALKTARQRNEESAQPQHQSQASKAQAKKTSGKQESRSAGKTRGTNASKPSDAHSEVEETAAEQSHGSTEITGEAEVQASEAEESQSPGEKTTQAHDPHAHTDPTDHDAPPADAAAAQLIRPVQRAKDDDHPKHAKEEQPEATDGDQPATATTATPLAASPATQAGTEPAAKRTKGNADDAHAASTAQNSADAQTQQGLVAVAAQSNAAAQNPQNTPPSDSTSSVADQAPGRQKSPIVSALGTEPAPIQPASDQDASSANHATAPSNVDLPVNPETPAQDAPPPDDAATDDAPAHKTATAFDLDLDPAAHLATDTSHHPGEAAVQANKPPVPPPSPEVDFAQTNHDRIVTGVHSQLLPHGGAMEIRLDPPELGALKVMVEMRDGVMNATFQTSNEQATQLLSHSLNQLKHVLESQGVSVERIQVQQAPKNEHTQRDGDRQQQQQNQQRDMNDDHAARQEQQRKEMMRRMWRRVSGAGDPIDYTA
jgi:flagellar hook-length control protein FliK